jgi:phosphoribosylformylglycinamidine synthase
VIDQSTIERHGLAPSEYARIVEMLGREPTMTELGIFSVMWSEHCSYKSSRVHLRRLPTTGKRVLQGPGENAGAVDIGDGLAAVFKIESHNHPSFIEPYQGAATGVGGIIRDIFTMGARPIALLNSLRFGPIDRPDVRRIMEGVVAGIAGYGNSIGIPTVGGEVVFEEPYAGNPLVNVFCLGTAKASDIIKGVASGVGNSVYYVGAKTGRDGIHGATMASAEFDEKAAEKRPAVQVGDPFMEKLLLEACLEVMRTDALVGIQDMGAAGLTCSTCEMGSRAGTGVEIDVTKVPQRETGMTPYEIMLSESQERMLLVVKRGREQDVERIFDKWDLHAVHVGTVTNDGLLRVKEGGRVVAEIPNTCLTDEAPLYERPMHRPEYLAEVQELNLAECKEITLLNAFKSLLGSANIASKRWVYRQYDHMVRTNTIGMPGTGAGVVRVKGTRRALALSVDGNGRACYLDPFQGAALAVAEAARNVACVGAEPIGATNCLNAGNPERPEIMWQFAQVVDGISAACRALDIPITGGNVSLYNETEGRAVYPTPVIGVVGLIEDDRLLCKRMFPGADLSIVLLGSEVAELGGSEYLKLLASLVRGRPASVDFVLEGALQRLVIGGIRDGLIRSAHDCSDGGLAVTLAECAFDTGGIGLTVDLPAARTPLTPTEAGSWNIVATLFGEAPSRIVVSIEKRDLATILARAAEAGVPAREIGQTGGSRISITVEGESALDIAVSDAETIWSTALERHFRRTAA